MANKKYTVLKSHPKYGYFAGDEAEFTDKQAEELLASKHIQEVKAKDEKAEAPEPKTATVKAPEVHTRAAGKPDKPPKK